MDQYTDLGGAHVRYRVVGNGEEAIIFIHGSSLSLEMWTNQVSSPLLSRYKLITFDLLGHGGSEKGERASALYSLSGLAGLLPELVAKLGLRRYIFAGISLGATIIAEAAPLLGSCQGYFLASSPIINNEFNPVVILKPSPHMQVMMAAQPTRKEVRDFILSDGGSLTEDQILSIIESFENTDTRFRPALGAALGQAAWTDEIANLRKTGKPVCMVEGKFDGLASYEYLEGSGIKKWKEKIFWFDCGHMINWEMPEDFNRLLASYANDIFES